MYARVLEPIGVTNPPTLLFGHGIGVEYDHWRNTVDFLKYLPQLGIRVIRPEAAWHGRRVPDGFYGGEYFLSTTPLSGFDFFAAQLKNGQSCWIGAIHQQRSSSHWWQQPGRTNSTNGFDGSQLLAESPTTGCAIFNDTLRTSMGGGIGW